MPTIVISKIRNRTKITGMVSPNDLDNREQIFEEYRSSLFIKDTSGNLHRFAPVRDDDVSSGSTWSSSKIEAAISGVQQSSNATELQGIPISEDIPDDDEVLVYNYSTNTYEPGPIDAIRIRGTLVAATPPTNKQFLIYNSTTQKYEPNSISTYFTFISMSDTPSTYSGHSGEIVRVNSSATGIEFSKGNSNSLLATNSIGNVNWENTFIVKGEQF